MSRQLVLDYFNEIDRLKKYSGTTTEGVVSEAFKDLLKAWSRQKNLVFLAQYEFDSTQKTRIRPDGTILHDLRVPLGYWEAKDEDDDLDDEIGKKLRRGYPQDNIIFEDSREAVLIQNRQPVMRCAMTDSKELLRLLELFFGYERAEIAEFHKAVEQFKADLPAVLGALREKIEAAYGENSAFAAAAAKFLDHAKETINPTLGDADVREMLIQHILTEEIFSQVFDDPEFHRKNNIAKELYQLEGAFFTGGVKRDTLRVLQPYYATIRSTAALISSHSEKQSFLKVIYENFYKVYDKKKADRLGVIYTPNEIVRFMIEGADWLCQKHFGKALIDPNVEILDPATGTGTFICELLEHFRGQPEKLARKYKEELHANEVAILPYYVANLNIEATYAAITGQYAEYPSLCFVDTLDNVASLGIRRGHQHELFAGLSDENVARVKRQNGRRISVIIGNPPYNANQQNENDNNKNRTYPHIDALIKQSYIAQSTAQKTKQYDMYKRFLRWATDRLGDEGIIAFVTNNAFIDARQDDGFRKVAEDEFSAIWLVNLKGNARTSGERRQREGGNVFDDQIRVGVAVSFFIKTRKRAGCVIYYQEVRDYAKGDEKRDFLARDQLSARTFETLHPDKSHNWINLAETNWDDLIPVASKETKQTTWSSRERAIFKIFSLGVVTNRDEWVLAPRAEDVEARVGFLVERYNAALAAGDAAEATTIKWTRNLKRYLAERQPITYRPEAIQRAFYRPFVDRQMYYSGDLNEMLYQIPQLFSGSVESNPAFAWVSEPRAAFSAIAFTGIPNKDTFMPSAGQLVARYRYTSTGERIDNITSWAENKFQAQYGKDVTKDDIFAYVYAVLHDPVYREKYAINLKREFPRIPVYPDFKKWVAWGKDLMALHIGYESVDPWPLKRLDTPDEKARAAGVAPKAMLKADKDSGSIRLDSETQLSGIPPEVWDYKLGNRSGVEWILDQYKEKTPKDPTIREKFNTYRFADYKEKVIDLIARVTRVSVETVAITEAMKAARRD